MWTRLTITKIPIASASDDQPLVAKLADQTHTSIFERLAELKTKQSD
jgi:hypothetical protein